VPETYILTSVPTFPYINFMPQSFLTKLTPVRLVTEVTEYHNPKFILHSQTTTLYTSLV
jgi:hypothetical protein